MADLTVVHRREQLLTHYKSMGLKMCGKYDHEIGARDKMTGWGVISADRAAKKISRSARIKSKEGGKK